jgi:hypothetical protein
MQAKNAEPSGTTLQIYPTGVYDTFPSDGLTIAFGPELREKIEITREQHCNNKPEKECRNALSSVLQTTDVSMHVKRFIPVAAWLLGIFIAVVAAEVIAFYNLDIGKEMELSREDLDQLHMMATAGVQTFAVATSSADAATVVDTISFQPPATITAA